MHVTPHRDSVLVHLEGDLDLMTTGRVRRDLAPFVDSAPSLVLDLADVVFIDSAGIGLLLSTRSSLLERGATLEVRNPSSAVRQILDVTGLGGVLLET